MGGVRRQISLKTKFLSHTANEEFVDCGSLPVLEFYAALGGGIYVHTRNTAQLRLTNDDLQKQERRNGAAPDTQEIIRITFVRLASRPRRWRTNVRLLRRLTECYPSYASASCRCNIFPFHYPLCLSLSDAPNTHAHNTSPILHHHKCLRLLSCKRAPW